MATRFFPFAAGDGATVLEDRWQAMARRWLSTGVLTGYLGELAVTADGGGMYVTAATGGAWVEGFYFDSDAATALTVAAANATDPRIDRVVVRLDRAANTVAFVVLTGTAAASPTPPALTQTDGLWELLLADVTVPAAAGVIVAGNVTDRRIFTRNLSEAAANAAYVAKAGDSISGDLAVAGLLTARSGGTTGEALRIGNDASFWDIDETSMIAVRKADGTAAGTAAGLVADKGFRSSGMRISGGFVGAEESTTSTTYTNLTTVGAEYTFTGPPSGMVLVAFMARTRNGDAGGSTLTSFELVRNSDNVITEAVSDARAFQVNGSTFASGFVMDRVGVTPGASYTARMKYRASNTVNSVGYWRDRRLLVIPSL
jgi:hypothetical protein